MQESRRGFLFGVAAYSLWGAFPLYWPLLEPAGAVEILTHRVLWSAITMAVVVVLLRRTPHVRAVVRDRRTFAILAFAAVVISFNWAAYIWGWPTPATTTASPAVRADTRSTTCWGLSGPPSCWS